MKGVETSALSASYRFQKFELLPGSRTLRVDGDPVRVTPRAFDLLVALVERAGRLVSKNELLELVWPQVVVEENNIEVQISALRKLLGQQAIATVPGRGYRFTLLPDEADSSPQQSAGNDRSAALPRGNLPAQLPPLYGRIDETVTLTRLLERHRVVSVVGPGGIGKTRTALAVAHGLRGSYADGAWLIECAPLTDPSLVVATVARVLGQLPAPKEEALVSLVDWLRTRQLLLLLDNCEHLLAAVAEFVATTAAAAPGVRLLITSQEPLHLPEEQIMRLNALAVPLTSDLGSAHSFGSVELFVARAQAADPRFSLNRDNVGAVVEICTRLDGIALAIELAAARVPLLGVHGVRQRLHERLKLLAGGGARALLPRHQALRAALEWSIALLSADERSVFERLGVFVGSFSLEAAQRVASDVTIDVWAVLDHLAALVDKSLVIVDGGEVPRYRLLESSRALALERLAQANATELMRSRHAQAIADTVAGDDAFEALQSRIQRIVPDLDNVRAAATWATGPTGDRQVAVALAGATTLLWDVQGCNDEGDRLYRQVEPWVDDNTAPRLAARFWYAVSQLRLFNQLERPAAAALRAAELFRSLADRVWECWALMSAAENHSYLGDRVAAERALAAVREQLDPTWPSFMQAFLEQRLAQFEFFTMRRLPQARKHVLASLAITRRQPDPFLEYVAELLLLMIDYGLGDFDSALRCGLESLRRPEALEGGWRRSIALATVGAAFTALGRLEEAELALRDALPRVKRATGSANWALNHVVFLVARQSRFEQAARLIGYIDASRTAQMIVQSPTQRRSYDEAMSILTPVFDADTFAQLRQAGCSMTESEATELAFPLPR
jgi:predicted ATPase/DNA-binding winged helix-turn-helix (wHTH) protein